MILTEIENSLTDAEEVLKGTVEPEKKTNARTSYPMSEVFTNFERNNTDWIPKHPRFDRGNVK